MCDNQCAYCDNLKDNSLGLCEACWQKVMDSIDAQFEKDNPN